MGVFGSPRERVRLRGAVEVRVDVGVLPAGNRSVRGEYCRVEALSRRACNPASGLSEFSGPENAFPR